MKTEEFAFTSIAELAPLIQKKEVSPLEVTQAHLDRIDRLNDEYLAYLTILKDAALAAARSAEQEIVNGQYRGPLHGIPIALKDLFAVKGVRMTCGSKILADHIAESDATVVTRLRQAGTILLGKLNMHEFAWGGTSLNPHYGTPRNPWGRTRLPVGRAEARRWPWRPDWPWGRSERIRAARSVSRPRSAASWVSNRRMGG